MAAVPPTTAQIHMNHARRRFHHNYLIPRRLFDEWRVCGQPPSLARLNPFARSSLPPVV